MTTAFSGSVASHPVPEFDTVVLGRSFTSQRVAARLRHELQLAVHEIAAATLARYDDIEHRWEIRIGHTTVARAKFVIDAHGRIPVEGRDEHLLDTQGLTAHGFPNLFRPIPTEHADAVDYTVGCIGYMRTNGLDYVERRRRVPIADDDFPELSFDRPAPILWFG